MMVQLVDTVSWVNALSHETKTWRSAKVAFWKNDDTHPDWSADHCDNSAVELCRLENSDNV